MAEGPTRTRTSSRRRRSRPRSASQFMNRFTVTRADTCISCGLCESLCPYGVHKRIEGHARILPAGRQEVHRPVVRGQLLLLRRQLPHQLAVRQGRATTIASMGDPRWSAEMILATWRMAETGRPIAARPPGQHRQRPGEGSTSSTSGSREDWPRSIPTRISHRHRPEQARARARGYASRSRSTAEGCRSGPSASTR